MLSLYIHIPICHYKCWYCSFNVIPLTSLKGDEESKQELWSSLIHNYLDALHRQIDEFAAKLGDQEIRTIYFGGGTPSTIGSAEMIKLIDHIAQVRNVEYLEELSIEINPDPVDDMLDMIKTISLQYAHFPRVRFSVGIQSFDNEVLQDSWRQYNFHQIVSFLRRLTDIKMSHNIFNFDFIAFWKFNTSRKGEIQLRDPAKLDFFQNFVHSGFADSFSLYTLELFPGSQRYNEQYFRHNYEKAGYGLKKYGSDEDVYEEFEVLKSVILDAGYQRYEISNYSRAGANSIHNRVYRAMWEWLGLGTGATSHLKKSSLEQLIPLSAQEYNDNHSWHISIVPDLKRFVAWTWIDEKKTELLSEQDFLKEKFLMGMRTMEGVQIQNLQPEDSYVLQSSQTLVQPTTLHSETKWTIEDILVENREEKIQIYLKQWLCKYKSGKFFLTDSGMDVYNSIISDLMK